VTANSFSALPWHPHAGASVDIVLDKAGPLTPARRRSLPYVRWRVWITSWLSASLCADQRAGVWDRPGADAALPASCCSSVSMARYRS
jgi:hypothetical protein